MRAISKTKTVIREKNIKDTKLESETKNSSTIVSKSINNNLDLQPPTKLNLNKEKNVPIRRSLRIKKIQRLKLINIEKNVPLRRSLRIIELQRLKLFALNSQVELIEKKDISKTKVTVPKNKTKIQKKTVKDISKTKVPVPKNKTKIQKKPVKDISKTKVLVPKNKTKIQKKTVSTVQKVVEVKKKAIRASKKKGVTQKKAVTAETKKNTTQKKAVTTAKKNNRTQKKTAENGKKAVTARRESLRIKNQIQKRSAHKAVNINKVKLFIKSNSESQNVVLPVNRELEKPVLNQLFAKKGEPNNKMTIEEMAVKKHGLVTDNHNQLDMQALAQYIQLMNEQNGYLPPAPELIKNCTDIVKCLARSPGNEERRWEMLQAIEEFLLRVVNTVDHETRTAIVTGVVDKFYSYISDPQSDAGAATSIVLVVLDTSSVESLMSTARWMVQQGENGPACAGLRSSLSCLYAWLSQSQSDWQCTPVLGDYVMSFIKALEESERFDVLIEVSVDNLDRLFSAMDKPCTLRQPNADVIFHVLASLRQSSEAFDKISHHVGRVLTNLASDSGQFSRQLLQNVVDILTATVDYLVKKTRGGARTAFKDKYGEVILCLERHMASRGCQQLKTAPWPARIVCPPREVVAANPPTRPDHKVGLLNLGNTCYMNSVMQALLVTRRFSTHVMLHMTDHPYWSIAAMLFGKLVHSVSTKLDSHDFFETMRPTFFTSNNQHDSSEFLGYFFELLQSFEHMSDENYDYSKPPVLSTANRWRSALQSYTPPSSDNEAAGSGSNRRSVSPRPGGSGGSGSSGLKRVGSSGGESPPRKRTRFNESSSFRRDSYIDSVFGGVLLTRLECVHCQSSSISRDVFRDLQLAFPEKPAAGQHDVQSLLNFYCSKERLTGENQYQCRDCGVLRDAERTVVIESMPNYLILVLKNFKFEWKQQVQSKLIHKMYYNPTISLVSVRAHITSGQYLYNLYAAVVHAGSTLDSGHYYTIAKDGGAWHKYNDDEVVEAHESQINELEKFSTPYLLFYRRIDIDEDTAPALEDLPPKIQTHILAHNKHYMDDTLRP